MPDHENEDPSLRQRALEILHGQPLDNDKHSPEEIERGLFELRVYQTELEIQNEELRAARRELEAARTRLADLYDFAPVGYFTITQDGTVQDANFTAAEQLGVNRKHLKGHRFQSWVARASKQAVGQHFERLFNTELPQRDEVQLIRANGDVLWAQLESVVPETGEDPKVCRTVVLDISERKAAEEQRLRAAIVEHAEDPIISATLDETITSWNAAAKRMFGYQREEIEGKPLSLLFPGYASPIFSARQVRNGGVTTELTAATWGGQSFFVSVTASPIRERGKLTGISLTVRDITARVRAEAALRASEERYRTLFQSIDEGFCVIEMIYDDADRPVDYRFLDVNPAFVEQTGLEDAVGKQVRHLVPQQEEYWFETYGRIARTRVPERFTQKAEHVGNRWYDVYAFPVGQSDEHKVGVLFNDISQRMRMEAAEREQRQFAEALAEIAQALNSTLQLEEVLDLILQHVERVVAHDVAEVMLFEGEVARVARSTGWAERGLADTVAALEFNIAETPNLARLMQSDGPVLIPDVTEQPGWITIFDRERLRSYLGAPIRLRGQTIGCLNLISTQPGFFRQQDAQRLQAFADQAANAIHNAQLFAEAAEAARLRERHRLARDLHDAVSQTLFSASVIAELLPDTALNNPSKLLANVETLHILTRSAMAEMRALLLELRPERLEHSSLPELLEQLVHALRGRRQIDVSLQVIEPPTLPPETRIAFYRVAQEALNNVAKHSKATEVSITLVQEQNRTVLTIEDNGVGFRTEHDEGGIGLHSMRERAEAIGATLEVTSAPGSSTRVRLAWSANSREAPAG